MDGDGDVLDLTQDDSDDGEVPEHTVPGRSSESDALFDEVASTCVASLRKKDSSVSTDSGVFTLSGRSEVSRVSKEKNGVGRRRKSVGSLQDKVKKKTDAALEREAKKKKLAEERAAKQAANEMKKIYKPGECMKHMCVEMHPSLADSWYCADIQAELTAAGAKLTLDDKICEPTLIMWSRTVERKITDTGQVGRERAARALCVLPAASAAPLVRAGELAPFAARVAGLAACTLTLVVFGVKEYFKSSNRKTKNSNKFQMTQIELELAITDLLVSTDCDTVVVNTPNELALLIVQYTKAIAETPYKMAQRECDGQVEYYMRGDNRNCVTVDKDGNGLSRLWQQMIAVLPSSSLDTARAICAQYKSPLQLFEAVQTPSGVQKLADVGVTRAAMPAAKARKVGPEFARKLQKLFDATNGDSIIQ